MIPLHEIDKPHNYAYVTGCRNVAWLVGRLHAIDEEKRVLNITRSDEDSIIPVTLERGDNIPNDLKAGDIVKLICHIYSGVNEENEDDLKAIRTSRLIAKFIGRPTLLDMRPKVDFRESEIDSSLFEEFDLPSELTPVSNNLELAGFVDGTPVLVRDRDHDRDRMVFMLRQSNTPKGLIPIEIAGKHAPLYRKLVKTGMAVFVNGIILSGKRHDTGEPVPIIRSNHVRKADPEKDFKFEKLPDWVVDIRRRHEAFLRQERARLEAEAAARRAEEIASSLD